MKTTGIGIVAAFGGGLAMAAVLTYRSVPVVLDTAATLGGEPLASEARATRPGAAFESAGHSWWIAWRREPSEGDLLGLGRLQRFSARGFRVGDPVDFAGDHVQLAWSATASMFLAVYDEDGSIKARRFRADGTAVGTPILVGGPAGGWSGWPHVDVGASRWFVAWYQKGGTAFGQFVNPDGTLWGGTVNVSGTGELFGAAIDDRSFEPPRTAYLGGTHLVVTRTSFNAGVGYRVDDATGLRTGAGIPMTSGDFINGTCVTAGPDAASPGFLVCWRDLLLDFNTGDGGCSIKGMMVTPAGVTGPVQTWAWHPFPGAVSPIATPCWDAATGAFRIVYSYTTDVTLDEALTAVIPVSKFGILSGAAEVVDVRYDKELDVFPVLEADLDGRALLLRHPFHELEARVLSPQPFAATVPSASAIAQYTTAGVALPLGGRADSGVVLMKGPLAAAAGGFAKLEVELQPVGLPFAGTATQSGAWTPPGGETSVTVKATAPGPWRMRVRAVDEAGVASAWSDHGGNADGAADFVVGAATPASPEPEPATGGGGGGGCSASGGAALLLPLALLALAVPRR